MSVPAVLQQLKGLCDRLWRPQRLLPRPKLTTAARPSLCLGGALDPQPSRHEAERQRGPALPAQHSTWFRKL